ncbi:MAG: DUF2141 domain-containing protein [Bacteroidota bacterium]
MKTSLLFLFLFNIFGMQLPGELKVIIENIDPVEGKLYVGIYDHSEKYNFVYGESAVYSQVVTVEASTQTIVFKDVPDGEFAITVFQDLNGNGKLDLRKGGIPTEPYGFSNNMNEHTGPPTYDRSKFYFTGNMEMKIELQCNE